MGKYFKIKTIVVVRKLPVYLEAIPKTSSFFTYFSSGVKSRKYLFKCSEKSLPHSIASPLSYSSTLLGSNLEFDKYFCF